MDTRLTTARYRSTIITVILLSVFLNALVLSGSIYMMLVYDMVIPSRNGVSLIGLLLMLVVAYVFQAGFENLRSNLMRRAATDIHNDLSQPTYVSSLRQSNTENDPVRDLDAVRAYLSGPGPAGLIDMPWMVVYLAILYLLHPWIGVTATVGIVVLIGIAWLTNAKMKMPAGEANGIAITRGHFLEETRRQAGPLAALGMTGRISGLWRSYTERHLAVQQGLATTAANLSGASRTFRMLLQSLILTTGAMLVISDKATGGVIFASSIIGSRALAPIEAAIGNWKQMLGAREAWARIKDIHRTGLRRMPLPAPVSTVQVERLTVEIPGRKDPILTDISFTLKAGEILAIVGPSASGKTTLLRAIAGMVPQSQTSVRLDGASLDQWDEDDLGRHLGYLPQDVAFLSGTVSQNIARFDMEADPKNVVAAAMAAGAHDLVVRMPDGYNSLMAGSRQSGGQRQRIGLARALYDSPFLLLLDEPNSNLDAEGEAALSKAIADTAGRGGICIVASHRPGILQVATHIMVLRDGRMQAYGRRDDILPRLLGRTNEGAMA